MYAWVSSGYVQRAGARDGLSVAVLALGAFTGVANGALLSPLLTPISRDFGLSESATGQLNTVTALAAMLFALIAAPWMNRFSRRSWLRYQIPVVALAAVLAAVAPNFAILLVARLLAGIGGSLILATCMAATGDLFPDEFKRNRAIGIIVSATTVAIVAGLPIFAQIESVANWRWSMTAMLVPLGLLFAGTSLLPVNIDESTAGAKCASIRYATILRDPRHVWLLGTMVIYMAVYAGWLTYFSAYLWADFSAGASTLGVLFLVSGVAEIVANNLTPALLRRFSAPTIYTVTTIAWSANLVATGVLYRTVWSLVGFITITGIAACVLYMAIYVRAVEAEPEVRGTLLSLVSASSGLGAALGALIGGVALAVLGDYVSVYRLLGIILIASAVTFAAATENTIPRTKIGGIFKSGVRSRHSTTAVIGAD